LDPRIKTLADTPHTISYVIRKRQQIDSLSELPPEKRPTDEIIWDGTPEDLDEWIEKVFDSKHKATITDINLSEVEE
jgi:hypothetical protein